METTSGRQDSSHQPEEEDKVLSYNDKLPSVIASCVRLFGEDDPFTMQFKQELIDLTQPRKDNPNYYEGDEDDEEQWHAGMVPNLRPKREKGLEEEDSELDSEEDSEEDLEDGPAEDED